MTRSDPLLVREAAGLGMVALNDHQDDEVTRRIYLHHLQPCLAALEMVGRLEHAVPSVLVAGGLTADGIISTNPGAWGVSAR